MKSDYNLRKRLLLTDVTNNTFYRILNYDSTTGYYYIIKFFKNGKIDFPERILDLDLEALLDRNELLILDHDIFAEEHELNEITPSCAKLRDRAWNQIKHLVTDEPSIYIPSLRNALINEQLRCEGSSSLTAIYKWLKIYWRGGMTPNSLIPNYRKCGAPGSLKSYAKISQHIKDVIKKGYKEFYLERKGTLVDARLNTLKAYCNSIPTSFSLVQFKYWGQKAYSPSEITKYRVSKRYYKANRRLLHGRVTDHANGPGKLYQIDWTIRDIHVVSTLDNSQYIGRPYLYIVVDTFSRAITGLLLTFETPSYITLCNALYNTGRDKVEFAKECGLEIGPDDWPIASLPNRLVGDRGELLSKKADSLVNNLNITVENTPAYRPDLKPVVERLFDTIQKRVKDLFFEKGQVDKNFGERLAADSRLEATVTLTQLYKIAILSAIEYNNSHWIDEYPLTNEIIKGHVNKIPIQLYRWGISNGYGTENVFEKKKLWCSLLEQKLLIPSRKGIRLNGQDFVPVHKTDFELLNNLIDSNSCDPISISYDPRVYNDIYWVYQNRFIPLRTRGRNDAQYENEWEAIATEENYKVIGKKKTLEEDAVKMKSNDAFSKILSSKQQQVKINMTGSKVARKKEIDLERKRGPKVITLSKNEETTKEIDKYSKPSYLTELSKIDTL